MNREPRRLRLFWRLYPRIADPDLRLRIPLRLGSPRIWITLSEPQKPAGTAPARAADEPCSALLCRSSFVSRTARAPQRRELPFYCLLMQGPCGSDSLGLAIRFLVRFLDSLLCSSLYSSFAAPHPVPFCVILRLSGIYDVVPCIVGTRR